MPALSLEGPNAITVQRIEPLRAPSAAWRPTSPSCSVDEGASATRGQSLGHRHAHRAHPARASAAEPAESLLYFFSARGGTFQLDCQFTESTAAGQVVKACKRVTKTVEFD